MTSEKLVCPHCGASRKKTQSKCVYCGAELEVEESSLEQKTEDFMEKVIDNFASPVIKHGPRVIGIAIGILMVVFGVLAIFMGTKINFFADSDLSSVDIAVKVVVITIGGIMSITGLSLLISAMVHRKK